MPSPFDSRPGDSENDLLKRICGRLGSIETILAGGPPQAMSTQVEVTNFPVLQPVAGNVSVTGAVSVSGQVSVDNFPATQVVSGTVDVANFPLGGATEATLSALLARFATNYGKPVNYFAVSQGGAGPTVIAAASGGSRHKVVGFMMTCASNSTVQFLSGVTPLTGPMDIPARGNLTHPTSLLSIALQTAVGEALSINSTGGAMKGFVAYLTEP